jgi:hypothetical protein
MIILKQKLTGEKQGAPKVFFFSSPVCDQSELLTYSKAIEWQLQTNVGHHLQTSHALLLPNPFLINSFDITGRRYWLQQSSGCQFVGF